MAYPICMYGGMTANTWISRSISARKHSSNTSAHEGRHRTKSGSRQDFDENGSENHTCTYTQHAPVSEVRRDLHTNDSTPQYSPSEVHWDNSDSTPLNYSSSNSSINPTGYPYEEPKVLTDSTWTQEQTHPHSHTWSGLSVDSCPSANYPEYTAQLHQWAYETSNANLTIAERFEKRNWETERREKL